MTTRCPALPRSMVPRRLPTPAIAAASEVKAAMAASAGRPAAMTLRTWACVVSAFVRPSVAKANLTPALCSSRAVSTRSFHLALRWTSTRRGSFCSAGSRLR